MDSQILEASTSDTPLAESNGHDWWRRLCAVIAILAQQGAWTELLGNGVYRRIKPQWFQIIKV